MRSIRFGSRVSRLRSLTQITGAVRDLVSELMAIKGIEVWDCQQQRVPCWCCLLDFLDIDKFAMDILAYVIKMPIGAFVVSIRGFESAHRWA